MYGWCRRSWGLSHEDAEDLTADLTVRLMEKFQDFSYDPDQKFRCWLRAVTHNAVVDFWRKRSRIKLADGRHLEQITTDEDVVGTVIDQLLLLEARERVQARFNTKHWGMFVLLTDEGRTPCEVAEQFGVDRNVVDNAKYRVIQALKQEVASLS
jgi:RNA polymerase sigma factor (sigma-70 family)